MILLIQSLNNLILIKGRLIFRRPFLLQRDFANYLQT